VYIPDLLNEGGFDFFNCIFASPFLGLEVYATATLRDKSMAKLFNP